MKKLILLLFAINLYAQSPKQVLYSFYDWKYPKIKIESSTIGVIVEDPLSKSAIDNQVSAYAIKNLNLRNLHIVAPEKSDYLLYIQPISTELATTVEKINNINDISYIGKIIFSSKLNFTIKRKNEIVYTKDFNYSQVVSDVRAYNNFSIKTEEIANTQVQLLLKNSSVTIYQNCRDVYANTVLYNFFKEIKETIDFSRIEETLPLYKFKDDDLEQINKSVDAFEFTRKLEDKAFTALVPTPFRPTDFWNAPESYLPPVLILDTQSITLPKGMPRPKSLTSTSFSPTLISMRLPLPIINSSMELSIISFRRT